MPFTLQSGPYDCGLTCMKMICDFYDIRFNIEDEDAAERGVSLFALSLFAETLGFSTTTCRISLEDLGKLTSPHILYLENKHFIVFYGVKNNKYFVADPAIGILMYSKNNLKDLWATHSSNGIALLLKKLADKQPSY